MVFGEKAMKICSAELGVDIEPLYQYVNSDSSQLIEGQ